MSAKSILAVLKSCPTHHASVTREQFLAGWAELQAERINRQPSHQPTLPIMAALLLHDDRFMPLLNDTELSQLQALVQLALDRYEQQTNPPNKLGRLLTGLTKQES